MITMIHNRGDKRDGNSHWHAIGTLSPTFVVVQVYDAKGVMVQLPGAGPAIRQDDSVVYIPCLYESYYPLTVVTVA